MKKIILLSLSLMAGLLLLSNVTKAQTTDTAELTLRINTGESTCAFGNNLDLSNKDFSYLALTYTGSFATPDVESQNRWYCEDGEGRSDWTVTIGSTDIVNTTIPTLAASWHITDIKITKPAAELDDGDCAYAGAALTLADIANTVTSNVPATLFAKTSAQGEACKVGIDNVYVEVTTLPSQPVGAYSGTVTVSVGQNFTIL